MSSETTIGLRSDQLEHAAREYFTALLEENPRAVATEELLRRARNALVHAAAPLGNPLGAVLDDPERFGPPGVRDVLLLWAQQIEAFPHDRSAFSPAGQLIRFCNELVAHLLIEGSSIGTATALMLRQRADPVAAASAVQRARRTVSSARALAPDSDDSPALWPDHEISPADTRVSEVADTQLQERLSHSCRAERDQAFSVLVARHTPRLRSFCLEIPLDHHTTEDILQEVFADAYSAFGAHGTRPIMPRSLEPWLRGIARNRIAAYQRRTRRMEFLPVEDLESLPDNAWEHEDIHLRSVWATIKRVAASLSDADQHLLRLTLSGMETVQIGRELQIAATTARRRSYDLRTRITEGLHALLLVTEYAHDCPEMSKISEGRRREGFTAECRMTVLRHMAHCATCRANAHRAVADTAP